MYEPINLSKINKIDFPEEQYYNVDTPKNQIVLHHTVSYRVQGDIDTWVSNPERVATCIIIGRDGVPNQLYSSKKWAHHLGITTTFLKKMGFSDYGTRNQMLNKGSIGVEINNIGGLTMRKDGLLYDSYGYKVDKSKYQIIEYEEPFRGFKYFVKYTQEQIDTTAELLLYWNQVYGIPLNYNEDIWDISMRALNGEPGIFTHNSYRPDKSDIHPDPDMIAMLQSLSV